MPDDPGIRRWAGVPVDRLVVLAAALATVLWLLLLPDAAPSAPAPPLPPPTSPPTLTWTGPQPATVPARLPDGSVYRPRIFMTAHDSVGVATGTGEDRLLLHDAAGQLTELRSAPAGELPQFDGFAVRGGTLVWAESEATPDAPVTTSLWRLDWRAGTAPRRITTATGEMSFAGRSDDIVIEDGRVYWTASAPTVDVATEIRSVPLAGGRVEVRRVPGEFTLAGWPWLVSAGSGRGADIELVNLVDDDTIEVPVAAAEIVACGPAWCRVGALVDGTLAELGLMRPDGSQRRRIAGPDVTPTLVDAALLDRFVPLATDRVTDGGTIDLSLYDIRRDATDLVALDVADIQGRGAVVWWSTGTGADLMWHALDLREVD